MDTIFQKISISIAGLYTWMVTLFFGLVLLDIFYARNIPQAPAAFNRVSDLLLLVGALTLLAGLGAAVFSGRSKTAVLFYAASLLVLSGEFMLPILVSLALPNPQGLSWLRPLPSGLASVLAFLGLYRLLAQRPAALKEVGTRRNAETRGSGITE